MSGHDHDRDRSTVTSGDGDERLYRTIGAAHLALAGVANVAVGAGLVYLAATDRLLRVAFTRLDTYVSDQTLVREAPALATAAGTGAIVLGVALAVLGLVGFAVAVGAIRERRAGWWVPTSVASALDPLVAPLALVAAVLLWLGRPGDPDS